MAKGTALYHLNTKPSETWGKRAVWSLTIKLWRQKAALHRLQTSTWAFLLLQKRKLSDYQRWWCMNASSLAISNSNFWKRGNKAPRISPGHECIYSPGAGWHSNYFWEPWCCLVNSWSKEHTSAKLGPSVVSACKDQNRNIFSHESMIFWYFLLITLLFSVSHGKAVVLFVFSYGHFIEQCQYRWSWLNWFGNN